MARLWRWADIGGPYRQTEQGGNGMVKKQSEKDGKAKAASKKSKPVQETEPVMAGRTRGRGMMAFFFGH